ncbi:MAG: flagellar motor switch protein FliG [Ilumatobacter sp.]
MSVIETTAAKNERQLSGVEKAAIVLLELGTERASQIMKMLGETQATIVGEAIARVGQVTPSDAERSMREFAALAKSGAGTVGGIERARDLLAASVGQERADAILDELIAEGITSPFEFIARIEARQLVNFLGGEHPQTIAAVVAHVPSEMGTQILAGLSDELRQSVSVRLAKLERVSSQVMQSIVEVLERRFKTGAQRKSEAEDAGGVQRLVDILNRSDRNTEKSIFEALEAAESDLADTVRSLMFVFEDILELEDRSVQMVLRNVNNAELATALKGVDPEVRTKITSNMSERAAQNLIDEVDLLGQVRRSDVQTAQNAVLNVIRQLEEAGDIVISRGSDEFVL